MLIADKWEDYKLIKTSHGEKIELWGNYLLRRPDPQIIWDNDNFNSEKYDAIYHRSNQGGGYWETKNKIADRWEIKYNDLVFNVKLMGFKHTGVFPEQAVNWDYMINKIKKSKRPIKVLNLFAYTGGATIACLSAGAEVTHVDSSKGIVEWAKENVKSSHLDETKVRYLVDDVQKFVQREIRRGNKYDAIIMDPPSFGRGSNKELWKLEEHLYNLVSLCSEILSDSPLFFIINSYTTGISKTVLENVLYLLINNKYSGIISSDEIGLLSEEKLILPCGIYARWEEK